jgi:hypothetical protein
MVGGVWFYKWLGYNNTVSEIRRVGLGHGRLDHKASSLKCVSETSSLACTGIGGLTTPPSETCF